MIHDLESYQKRFLKIITKSGELKTFAPNVYQSHLNDIVKEQKKDNKPIRIRILKCRQIGCSTWASAFSYHFTATQFYKRALIIAHDLDSSGGLFDMCKRYWEFSPDQVKPMREKSNAKELLFNNPDRNDTILGLNSSIRIETAMKMSAGRSKTIQFLHMSEKAFWRDASTVQTGLFQSIPYKAGTVIIDESTANGISGEGETFYNDWHNGEFTNVFFNWVDNPEYEIDAPSDFVPTDYEIELLKEYPKLNERKLMFRRYKIKNEMGSAIVNPEDQFKQEFPLCVTEAFLSSGRPVFDSSDINKAIEQAKQFSFEMVEI